MKPGEIARVNEHNKALSTVSSVGTILGGPVVGVTAGLGYHTIGRYANKDLRNIYKKYGRTAQAVYDANKSNRKKKKK